MSSSWKSSPDLRDRFLSRSRTEWAIRSTVSFRRPPLCRLASIAAANSAKFSLRSRSLASFRQVSIVFPIWYSPYTCWNSCEIGRGHCLARMSIACGSDSPARIALDSDTIASASWSSIF